MSRRKQGRPQQRKAFDSLEQENDLLVCGDCQTRFPLHDIVQFIRHKKQCCNKENISSQDDLNKKPGNNNNNEINGHRTDDKEDDSDEEGIDLSRSSSRREVADETNDDIDDDNDDNSIDLHESLNLVNGEGQEAPGKEEKAIRKSDKENSSSNSSSCREARAPLRQKQVVDAESNTTHSEPSRFVCETCRSTYTSAWALLQHAQKEHGMKIYTSPSVSSSSQQSPSTTTSAVSPMELVIGTPRSSVEHRSMSTGSGGSASPYTVHTPNPFSSPFRLPLDSRLAHPNSLSPFPRSPNFDFDVINDCRLRPQLLARPSSGIEHPLFPHSPFDRSRPHVSPVLESHYDYYSMRLKQLASSPVVSQARTQFCATSPLHPPNLTPTTTTTPTSFKTDSPLTDNTSPAKGSELTAALTLPPKLKACEFCGKNFRFQSNLVVHRRSHTGEKPYKCTLCPHACTQQSKLKRHMKTHDLKTDGSSSPNTTAVNHKEGDGCVNDEDDDDEDDDDDMDDEDEEDEEEECEDEEEDDIEEEMNDEEREVLERMKVTQNNDEFVPEPGEIRPSAKRVKLENNEEEKAEESNRPNDLSLKSKSSESLLSEVMKRSGLNDIQTYNEAYKAALAESQDGGTDKLQDKKETVNANQDRSGSPRSPRSPKIRVKRELDSDKEYHKDHLFLGGTDLLGKSLKREPSTPSVWSPSAESFPPNNIDPATASIYSRLHHSWFADNSTRLFFTGYPPRFAPSRDLNMAPESHNGLNLSPSVATTSSALIPESPSIPALFKPGITSPSSYPCTLHRNTSSSSSSPTGNLALPNNNTPSQRKESRRNDTCEYCGKVFKNCSNLTVHRRSHTGEKPYKCNLCSYACAQSSKLTRHMKTHGRLGKDVYTCKFCNMPFSVPSTLEKHMRKCVENRNARLMMKDDGEISSDSNEEMSHLSDSASGVY